MEGLSEDILRHPNILLDYETELEDYLHPVLVYEEFKNYDYRLELIKTIQNFNKIDYRIKEVRVEDIKEFEKKFNQDKKYDFAHMRPFYYTMCKKDDCIKFYYLYYNNDLFLFHINNDNPMNYDM